MREKWKGCGQEKEKQEGERERCKKHFWDRGTYAYKNAVGKNSRKPGWCNGCE